MERKALGKGIGALIPDGPFSTTRAEVLSVPVAKIRPNTLQPREQFDEQKIADLAHSIREKGVIQPLLVRRQGDSYELIAGERRLRAAQSLNIQEVPVIVKDADDLNALELALIENIQREDLNPIEEAHAYQYLLDKFQLTQERIAEVMGKARVSITNVLRLLRLPADIQEGIKQSMISYGHGRVLLELDDPGLQRLLMQEVVVKGLSVRALESRIKSLRNKGRRRIGRSAQQVDPQIRACEEMLQHKLSTRVRIQKKHKRGTIEIEFYSDDDMMRIIAAMHGTKLDK
jgi:ParB family chromosome partitioning protein